MLIPGNVAGVAKQFLRCVLHQLAPNGILPQLFQSNIKGLRNTSVTHSPGKHSYLTGISLSGSQMEASCGHWPRLWLISMSWALWQRWVSCSRYWHTKQTLCDCIYSLLITFLLTEGICFPQLMLNFPGTALHLLFWHCFILIACAETVNVGLWMLGNYKPHML